jgi:hypothetical protein
MRLFDMPAPQALECSAVAIETVNRDHVHLTFWAGGALCRRALLL